MHSPTSEPHVATPERIEETRRWPARIVGLLLVIQGVGSLVVSYRLGMDAGWVGQLSDDFLSPDVLAGLSTTGLFALMALVAFVSAAGFVLVRDGAWLLAMVLEVLTLAVALRYHFLDGPDLVYILMAFGTFMVFYINSRPVRTVFHGGRPGGE